MSIHGDLIDRRALVTRHNIVHSDSNPNRPLQVGNGEFAFGADITGLQTFVPFASLSHWGWHSTPPPAGANPNEFLGHVTKTHGRPVRYSMPNNEQPELSRWLAVNPHRLNLGRVGLSLTLSNGQSARIEDLRNARQELDLWSGIITSRFEIEQSPVYVQTVCHPSLDAIAVRIESPLVRSGRLEVFIHFPYGDNRVMAPHVGDWDHEYLHETQIRAREPNRADFDRAMDGDRYHCALSWDGKGEVRQSVRHHYVLHSNGADRLAFVCAFAPNPLPATLPDADAIFEASRLHWPAFWNSGGAIDLSGSRDPRWRELERRIVLSQYLMAVNEAGSFPPQESGLVNNGWYGRFHFEMYWWHGAHYALWDR